MVANTCGNGYDGFKFLVKKKKVFRLITAQELCVTLVMVPTALVRPSLNTSLWSQCRYSGVLMKRKWTEALSPVRRQSLFMDRMVAVCLMLPQCTK